ncbi:MAG TPA: beta-ketoacyl-ACP synthase II [Acidimicrobiales bacterium]|nr:beta-ketoacyl-ACP synthase II [Acidimicrobiales bacterium]
MSGGATDHRGRPRVAVTGMGVKTPAGRDLATFWATLLEGRGTAATITRFDPADQPVGFACEVLGFDPSDYFGHKEARRADRVTQLGFAAATDALVDAGDLGTDPNRCGVVAGTGVGGLWTQEEEEQVLFTRGPTRVTPFLVPMMMANATAGTIAMRHGWKGPNICITTACAAGTHAVGEAARFIRDGSADVVLAGGTEAAITPIAMAAFARMGALSTRSDDPSRASRPFDPDRDGFVMGEGAGFLVLERWDRAEARGARVYGEILGYGRNSDAHHITAPSPDGSGAVACMELALEDAGIPAREIGHVNAHGTSTPLNDAAEAEALVKVFAGDPPPVTSGKGVTGHLIGAAGAVEAIAAILSARHGLVPPTANHERTDPGITIDVVAGSPRPVTGLVLSNSFGFGGHNATLVLAGFPE